MVKKKENHRFAQITLRLTRKRFEKKVKQNNVCFSRDFISIINDNRVNNLNIKSYLSTDRQKTPVYDFRILLDNISWCLNAKNKKIK